MNPLALIVLALVALGFVALFLTVDGYDQLRRD